MPTVLPTGPIRFCGTLPSYGDTGVYWLFTVIAASRPVNKNVNAGAKWMGTGRGWQKIIGDGVGMVLIFFLPCHSLVPNHQTATPPERSKRYSFVSG